MRKWIALGFVLILTLTGCDSDYLDRSVGVYYETQEEAENSNELSIKYKYQDGESSNDKRLKIDVGEKLEIEKVMTNGSDSYSIGYIAKNGTLQWHTFYNLFEKVDVFIVETEKPYVIREENEVYYKKDYDIYYPRHARYKLYLSSDSLNSKPTTTTVCKKVGDHRKCHEETTNNEVLN